MPTQTERWIGLQDQRKDNVAERAVIDMATDALVAELLPPDIPPPTISIGPDKTALVGEMVSFSAAVDGGKAPLIVVWNFGDLTGGAGMSTAHAYTDAGAKVVSVTVTDSLGRTAQDTLVVTVDYPSPTVSLTGPTSAIAGQPVQFIYAVSVFAPVASTLTWDYGDGVTGAVSTYTYAAAGTYTVRAVVKDSAGKMALSNLKLTVAAAPAPAAFDVNKPPTLMSVKDNGDGTVTGTATLPVGCAHCMFYYLSSAGQWLPPAGLKVPYAPGPQSAPPFTIPSNGNWKLSIIPWGINPVTGKLVGGNPPSGGSLPFAFPGGSIPPPNPPGPTPPGPGPAPLPAPLPPMARETNDRLLLTAAQVNRARDAASTPTQQWADFNQQIESLLPIVEQSEYQASNLFRIANYALAYRIFKADYPVRAAKYADKAIAIILMGTRDYLKGPKASVQFLARGDGVKNVFTIPNSDFVPGTFRAYRAPVEDIVTITRTGEQVFPAPYGMVNFDESSGLFYSKILSVTGADGTVYQEGVDWRKTADIHNDCIDWSLPGKKPAKGEKYKVEVATGTWNSALMNAPVVGNTFSFITTPTKDQTIWVEYMYGTSSADGSTLGYQQTHAGDGGFNTVEIDATYTSRSLLFLALGFAWIEDYPGFSPALRSEAAGLLERWADFLPVWGYLPNSPASNYGISHHLLRVLAGAALAKFDSANSARILTAAAVWRTKYVVPILSNDNASLKGGYWPEGDNYGPGARRCLIIAGIALEQAGYGSADLEREWCTESIDYFIHAQPTEATTYDGGDWFAYPAPKPGNAIFAVTAAFTPGLLERDWANAIIQRPGRANTADWADMLYRDPKAQTAVWDTGAAPLDHFARGPGLLIAQSDWSPQKIWLACQIGNILSADHQSYSPGQLQFQRGGDDLLANANCICNNQWAHFKSRDANTIHVNTAIRLTSGDGIAKTFVLPMAPTLPAKFRCFLGSQGVIDQGPTAVTLNGASMTFATAPAAGGDIWIDYDWVQDYPGSMGTSYTLAAPTVELADKYAYICGDFTGAWNARGGGSAVKEAIRQVVFFRSGVVVVYDRVTVAKAEYLKRTQWYSHPTQASATQDGNRFTVKVDGSQVVGETFSSDGPLVTTIKTQFITGQNGNMPARQISCQQVTPTAKVRFCTVFQIGAIGAVPLPVQFLGGTLSDVVTIGLQQAILPRDAPPMNIVITA